MTGESPREAEGSTPLLPDDGKSLGEVVGARPLPLIKTTWVERGRDYRRRRRRAAILYAGVLLFIGAMAAGFDWGVVRGGAPVAVRVAAGIGYLLPGVPAYLYARRKIRRFGFEFQVQRFSPLAGLSGILVFVITPIAEGLCVACLQAVLKPWFPGEQAARQEILRERSAQHPVLH